MAVATCSSRLNVLQHSLSDSGLITTPSRPGVSANSCPSSQLINPAVCRTSGTYLTHGTHMIKRRPAGACNGYSSSALIRLKIMSRVPNSGRSESRPRSLLNFQSVRCASSDTHACRDSVSITTSAGHPQTLYDVLGIGRDVQVAEIKSAYRQLARRCHPDTCHDPCMKEASAQLFLRVHEAYEILSDPAQRAQYDRQLLNTMLRGPSHEQIITQYFNRASWEAQLAGLKSRPLNRNTWASSMRSAAAWAS